MATSVGPDGISVTGLGWTTQSTAFNSNKNLESYGSPASSLFNPANRQGYGAWSFDPELATATPSSIATTLAVLVYVPQNFVCSKIDMIPVATAGNITVGLWAANAPAGTATPLAFSAATAASLASVNALSFNGTNSATSVTLTGGQSYFVTLFGSAATTVAGVQANTAYMANASNGLYTTSTVYRSASVATTAALTTASVFGTSTLTAFIPWVGLH